MTRKHTCCAFRAYGFNKILPRKICIKSRQFFFLSLSSTNKTKLAIFSSSHFIFMIDCECVCRLLWWRRGKCLPYQMCGIKLSWKEQFFNHFLYVRRTCLTMILRNLILSLMENLSFCLNDLDSYAKTGCGLIFAENCVW